MDPDLARKVPYNGFAADVWACGVILYIVLAGNLPYHGEFEADLFRKIQNGKFKSLPQDIGSQKVRHLLKLIFEVDANSRITAEKILEHPWLADDIKKEGSSKEVSKANIEDSK